MHVRISIDSLNTMNFREYKGLIMITHSQRNIFLKDVENALEELSFNLAHLDNKKSLDNIMQILYALRIAAITYDEYSLQRKVEELLAMMINHNLKYDVKIINRLYTLIETMIYPYKKYNYIVA